MAAYGEKKALNSGVASTKLEGEEMSERKAVWEFLEGRGPGGLTYNRFTVFLILVNIAAFIIGSSFDKKHNTDPATGKYVGPDCSWCDVVFFGNEDDNAMNGTSMLEAITAICFTIDWALRYWACLESDEYKSRADYTFSFLSMIDLISTLPFYIGFVFPVNFIATQFLRMFRLFRMMRAGKYARAFTLFDDVFEAKKNVMITAGFVGAVVWIIMAGFYFMVNRFSHQMIYCPKCPDVDVLQCSFDSYGFVDCTKAGCAAPNECWNLFESIPSSMFQTMLNLFGEFPLSNRQQGWGMVIASLAAMVAQVIFGIPCGIIGSGFEEQMDKISDEAEDKNENDAQPDPSYGSTIGAPVAIPVEEVSDTTFRGRVFNFLHGKSEASEKFRNLVVALIFTSTLSFMLLTLKSVEGNPISKGFLNILEIITTIIFISEYFLSAYSIGMDPAFEGLAGLWSHLTSFNQLVDLMAILPSIVGLLFGIEGGSGLLCIRALRLLRIVKTETFVNALTILKAVVTAKADILIITGFAALVFWVFFASVMYFLERANPDPDMAAYYTTIPTAMWMTLLNLSGEVPLPFYTTGGKVVVGIMGIFAVGFISVPIGALASGFQEIQSAREVKGEETPDMQTDERDIVEEGGDDFKAQMRDFLEGETPLGRVFGLTLMALVFVTVMISILETVPGTEVPKAAAIETFAVLLFSADYLGSFYSATNRLRFFFSFHSLLDVVALGPWYIVQVTQWQWLEEHHKMFLVFRILHLLRLDKEFPSLTLIQDVFRMQKHMLAVTAVIAGIAWVIFSSIMYLAESQDHTTGIDSLPLYGCSGDDCTQSLRYANFFSASGYVNIHLTGDYPLIDYNVWGRIICFFMIVVGVGIVSIPSGLIADGFSTVIAKEVKDGDSLLRDYDLQYRELGDTPAPREFASVALDQLQVDLNEFLNGKTSDGKLTRSFASDMFNKGVLVAIIVNLVCTLLESCPPINRTFGNESGNIFDSLEVVCIMIFSFEYFARIFSVTKDKEHLYSRWCYFTTFFGVVDFITIAPFYIELGMWAAGSNVSQDTSDVFRLVRLFRLLELEHFITAFTVLDNVFYRSKSAFLATGVLALCIWMVTTTLFYIAELDNPNWCSEWADATCATTWTTDCVCTSKSTFDTMPHALYYMSLIIFAGEWPIVDFTVAGKMLCFVTCIISIGLAALPIGTLFDSFSNVLEADGDLAKAMENEAEDEDSDTASAKTAEEGVVHTASAGQALLVKHPVQ